MINIKLTEQERNNLVIFLTDKGRLHLTGDEAFEFTKIVSKIANAKEDLFSNTGYGPKGEQGVPGDDVGIEAPIEE